VFHALALLSAFTVGGCSLLLDTSAQQCSNTQDCRDRSGPFTNATCENHVCVVHSSSSTSSSTSTTTGGGGSGGSSVDSGDSDVSTDPVWGCLGHVTMETPQASMANVTLPFWDLINMVPITGVGVLLCAKLDPECSRPIDSRIIPAGADGIARFKVPPYFNGYGIVYDLTYDGGYPDDAGDGGDGGPSPTVGRFLPSVIFFNPPIVNDTAYGIVPIFSRRDIDQLAALQGNTWDQNLGMLFAGMLDCSHKPAAGVTWDPSIVDTKTKRFFYVNGLPDESAEATDATGFGGLLNSRTGSVTIAARVQATGKRVGEATVFVRPGWASYTYLAPTPAP
jgi:hypothetical protein